MNQNQDQLMNAIVIPYPEPNTVAMEMYEHFYYDDIDPMQTFSQAVVEPKVLPNKYCRQYNLPCNSNAVSFNYEDEPIVPINLESTFDSLMEFTFHQQDLLANISMCYPSLGLKAIAEHVNCVYADSETMESFIEGQRIGDYEYIVSKTNYCTILFGRKQRGDEYMSLHFWLRELVVPL